MGELVTRQDQDGVAVLSYNRPSKHNAFSDAMDVELFDHLDDIHGDESVRCVIWRGEGPSFSAGRDMAELGHRPGGISDYNYIARGHARTRRLFTLRQPIIVTLQGWVLGGSWERALLCDIRIAADDAKMRLPEVEHGVIPDSAGVARIFQMCGHGLATELALTGRVMHADEALRHGLVSQVVSRDALDETAMAMATEIASRSESAVHHALGTIRAMGKPLIEATLDMERVAQTTVMASSEYQAAKDARAAAK